MTAARGDLAPAVPPLGKKVERPAPAQPEWVKTETPGIERNTRTGQLRTSLPTSAA